QRRMPEGVLVPHDGARGRPSRSRGSITTCIDHIAPWGSEWSVLQAYRRFGCIVGVSWLPASPTHERTSLGPLSLLSRMNNKGHNKQCREINCALRTVITSRRRG